MALHPSEAGNKVSIVANVALDTAVDSSNWLPDHVQADIRIFPNSTWVGRVTAAAMAAAYPQERYSG